MCCLTLFNIPQTHCPLLILDPGASHSNELTQLSGLLFLLLSDFQQSAVACKRRGKTAHFRRLSGPLLVPAPASDPVLLPLVLRLPLPLVLWLLRFLPRLPFSSSSTCSASSVVIGGGTDIGDELPILISEFINLRFLL